MHAPRDRSVPAEEPGDDGRDDQEHAEAQQARGEQAHDQREEQAEGEQTAGAVEKAAKGRVHVGKVRPDGLACDGHGIGVALRRPSDRGDAAAIGRFR